MTLFLPALTAATDDNGDVLPSATWKFYRRDTTTPVATSAGSTVTADSNGEFASITLTDGIFYRAELRDSTGRLVVGIDAAVDSLFSVGATQALDSDGNPLAGATWNFYTTATDTPQSVYSSDDLATTLGYSVKANAAGRFPSIYLDDAITYRAVLKDADGTTLGEIDPVTPGLMQAFIEGLHPYSDGDITYGRTEGYDAGTTGDVFVDKVNGNNANSGLTSALAKQTLAAALTVAQGLGGTRTIRLMGDGVRYYENISTTTLGGTLTHLKIKSYGTDMPWLSGATTLGSFTQCTSGDEAVVGANYASIYKATIATSSFPHVNYWSNFLTENYEPLQLAGLRGANDVPAMFLDATVGAMFEEADIPALDMAVAPTYYSTITHPGVLDVYTDAQLAQTVAALWAYPNVTTFVKVASVSSAVLTLSSNTARPNSVGSGGYALWNLPAAMTQGTWAYRDDGAGTLTIYVWPNDTANLTSGIQISTKESGIKFGRGNTTTIGSVTVEGIGLEMFSSDDAANSPIISNGEGAWTITQCHIDKCIAPHLIYLKFANNCTLDHITISRGPISFGIGTADSGGAGISGHVWTNLLAEDLSQTGYRMLGLRDSVIADCKSVRTSAGGHANAINTYQGCDNVAIVRFKSSMAPNERLYAGYGTNQAASGINWINCTFTMASDARGYVDQNVAGVAGISTDPNRLINCWVPHEPAIVTGGTIGINVGRTAPAASWEVYNCVAPEVNTTGGTVTRKNNLMTYSTGVTADASEEVLSDYALAYVDAVNDDFRAVAAGPLLTKAGYDVESIIAALEVDFPTVNFRLDQFGRVWEPATPGVGPFGTLWPTA